MKQHDLAKTLGSEWDRPDGFFARLRGGQFDAAGATRVLKLLGALELRENEALERDLARQLWYLPLFCQWQEERVAEEDGDVEGLKRFITAVTNALEDEIGVP